MEVTLVLELKWAERSSESEVTRALIASLPLSLPYSLAERSLLTIAFDPKYPSEADLASYDPEAPVRLGRFRIRRVRYDATTERVLYYVQEAGVINSLYTEHEAQTILNIYRKDFGFSFVRQV